MSEEDNDEEGKGIAKVEDGGVEVSNCTDNVGVREDSRAMAKIKVGRATGRH